MQVTVKLTDHTRILARPGTVSVSLQNDSEIKLESDNGELVLNINELQLAMEALRCESRAH